MINVLLTYQEISHLEDIEGITSCYSACPLLALQTALQLDLRACHLVTYPTINSVNLGEEYDEIRRSENLFFAIRLDLEAVFIILS